MSKKNQIAKVGTKAAGAATCTVCALWCVYAGYSYAKSAVRFATDTVKVIKGEED